MTIRHFNVILFHLEYLGLRLNTRKCVVSKLENYILAVVWDSTTMQAQLSPAWVDSIRTMVDSLRLGQEISVRHAMVAQNKGSSPI